MSDTPRTQQLLDSDAHKIDDDGVPVSCYRRMIEHARELERELDAATAQRDRLAEALKAIAHCDQEDAFFASEEMEKTARQALAELKGQKR